MGENVIRLQRKTVGERKWDAHEYVKVEKRVLLSKQKLFNFAFLNACYQQPLLFGS